MKHKKSITKKLFLITSIVLIVFITISFLIQTVFFENFYINWKKNSLETKLDKFKIEYDKLEKNEDISNFINTFEEDNNYKIIIRDSFGNLKYITKSVDEKRDAMRVRIMHQVISEQLNNKDVVKQIEKYGKAVVIVNDNSRDIQTKNIVGVVYNNKNNEIIYAFSSLQPVNEAAGVIKEFYLYFYIGAVLIIIILSLMYSNMIAKPLIRITKTASKMATLNFTEKCEVKSDDEIGDLADSLNFLSENLNNALTSLRVSNEKLEEDIEKERRLTEMRKDFVAAVSHELKTPITLIEGYTHALNDDVLEGEEKQYFIDVILDESKKMNNLVSDMLDLSQLESGSFKLIKEEFYLHELIKSVTKKFSSLINEKNIKLELNLIKNIKVNADWNRIEQVVTNYITNAIRHTNESGNITVKMTDKGDNISVEVENSGDKIADDELKKIWDNFYKIDKSRTRKFGGTGLGLAIVKNIILIHEGEYGVENTENGVNFYFNLRKE